MWIMLSTGFCWIYSRPGGATREKWRILDGKSESGLHDIWRSEGGSPRLC
jgi:hypothetical protein